MAVPRVSGEKVPTLRVGLLGFGVVGSAFYSLLADMSPCFRARYGFDIAVSRIAVRDLEKRSYLPSSLLSDSPVDVAVSHDVDVVVELMGGLDPALAAVRAALTHGKPVVSANKELLSQHLVPLAALASESGVDLLFDPAVAGAVPVVASFRSRLRPADPVGFLGIVNGTMNYVLSAMHDSTSLPDALARARTLGLAETDPSADVLGLDPAAKAALMVSSGFGLDYERSRVIVESMESICREDVDLADSMGRTVKPVVYSRRTGSTVCAMSFPALLPSTSRLASVSGSENAVEVETLHAGNLWLEGPGAGGLPTATSVLADVLTAAKGLLSRSFDPQGPYCPSTDSPPPWFRTLLPLWMENPSTGLPSVLADLDRHSVRLDSFVVSAPTTVPLSLADLVSAATSSNRILPRLVLTLDRSSHESLQSLVGSLRTNPEVAVVGQLYRFVDSLASLRPRP